MGALLGQFELTAEQRDELLSWSRSGKMDHRYVVRARAILALADGAKYKDVRQQTGLSSTAIRKWKRRFMSEGLTGLSDAPRTGRPRVHDLSKRVRVIQAACEKPEGGYQRWSQRRLAAHFGMSQSTISEILSKADIKPHKTQYWCGKSPDPEFESKMQDIVGLYLNPPVNALVLSIDEKTQIQALDRTQPELPLAPGKPKRQTATYKRNGTVSLIAALSVHSGEITAQPIESNNGETFLRFLKKVDRLYRRKKLHIIVDNLQVHKAPCVKQWLSKKRKFSVHFTPTYSSWLNQIEIWFNLLSRDVLRGAVWKSRKQLVDQIMEYVKTYNSDRAKPFAWTYDGSKKSGAN